MLVYVVHGSYHYDDYKRGESFSELVGVYLNKTNAYEIAIKKYLQMFESYAKYNYIDDIDCDHEIDKDVLEKTNELECEYCGRKLTSEATLDYNDKKNMFTKDHILEILSGESMTLEQKLDFIEENLYENILPEAEFSLTPTHTRYFVEETELIE